MKQKLRLLITAGIMTILFSVTAFAAGWTNGQGENSGRWWYDLGNGTWYAGTEGNPSWQWLDRDGYSGQKDSGGLLFPHQHHRRGGKPDSSADGRFESQFLFV